MLNKGILIVVICFVSSFSWSQGLIIETNYGNIWGKIQQIDQYQNIDNENGGWEDYRTEGNRFNQMSIKYYFNSRIYGVFSHYRARFSGKSFNSFEIEKNDGSIRKFSSLHYGKSQSGLQLGAGVHIFKGFKVGVGLLRVVNYDQYIFENFYVERATASMDARDKIVSFNWVRSFDVGFRYRLKKDPRFFFVIDWRSYWENSAKISKDLKIAIYSGSVSVGFGYYLYQPKPKE